MSKTYLKSDHFNGGGSESFRSFAPSVMQEAVAEWFEEDDSVPFMMQVFQVREEKRKLIPAVTHVDGWAGYKQ